MSRVGYVLMFDETRDGRRIDPAGLTVRSGGRVPIIWRWTMRNALSPVFERDVCVGAASNFVKGEFGLVAEITFDAHNLSDEPLYPSPDLDIDYRIAALGDVMVFMECRLIGITLVEHKGRPWENVAPLYIPPQLERL